ncbi:hypothetical protein ACFFX0_19260 [Citricoccus parietis]|uniref:Uncharacterized protein n=1 Tax=Citricoccus parietis TaxID=592307 RepID=A0ABV5G2Q5_9MICC
MVQYGSEAPTTPSWTGFSSEPSSASDSPPPQAARARAPARARAERESARLRLRVMGGAPVVKGVVTG